MPDSRPDAAALAEMVRDWLAAEVLPAQQGEARFQCRIAISLLATIAREIRLKPAADAAEAERLAALTGAPLTGAPLTGGLGLVDLNRRLCERIDGGEIAVDDPALLRHLAAAMGDALAINNPRWLETDRPHPPATDSSPS